MLAMVVYGRQRCCAREASHGALHERNDSGLDGPAFAASARARELDC
jgi:hypothetical protein